MSHHFPNFRLLVLLLVTLLAACASGPAREQTERELYLDARKNLDRGNFITAQTQLQELETRFPFGRYSEQSQLDMMYAQMRGVDYPGAAVTAQRFLRQHPGHVNSDYALYIRGLANYEMQRGVLENRMPTNQALRDLGSVREAWGDFAQLVTRHPDSEFTPDARSRMLHIRNQLAEQEVAIAWYYVRRGACLGAIKRARDVLANFPSAPALGDALVILSECHHRLEEMTTADRFLATLHTNYPNHSRLRDDGTLNVPEGRSAEDRSWLSRLSLGMLGNAPENAGAE